MFAARGGEIACLITEAAAGNMGVVPPDAGFTAALRRVTAEHGALLVSDEVMTGFRVSRAGWWGHEGVDVTPDLMTFGKVMGGGFPAAAFGGRADVMALLAPDGPVYQAGTLSGNPVATAAGLATLRACDDALYARLGEVSRAIADAASAALSDAGVPHRIQWAGSMFSVYFREGAVRTYDDARDQDTAAFGRFFHAMLDAGVYLPPSAFESWFVSGATTTPPSSGSLAALPGAARAAAGGRRRDACLSTQPGLRQSAHDVVPRGRWRLAPVTRSAPWCTCCATVRCTTRTDSSTAGCRATTCPGSVAGWPTSPPSTSATTTSPTWSPARSSGRRRPPRRSPTPTASRCTLDARVIEAEQRLRGPAGRGRVRHPQAPAALPEDAQPVPAVVGRALRRDRRADAPGRRRRPHRRPRATRPSSSATRRRSG